jgi:hypothetical protein
MAEALASCLDLYFVFYLFSRVDLKRGILKKELVRYCESFPKIRGGRSEHLKLASYLLIAADNPYRAFASVAREMFEAFESCLEISKKRRKGERTDLVRSAKRIEKNLKFSTYIFHFDIPVDVLYATSFCGFESSAKDLRDVKSCLNHLRRAKTMEEFLSKLGVAFHVV